jgi:DMSO/TMAO reductase YedYZ heme-binding membrane subunit
VVSGDAAAANFKNFEFLYRLGFAAFLIESLCDIALALILWALLMPVNRQLSLLAAFFGLVGTAIFAVAELFFFMPILVLGRPERLSPGLVR